MKFLRRRSAPEAGTDIPPPRLPPGTRIYAIGDIHGRADLLAAMGRTIQDDLASSPGSHAVTVLLGDYIDRGPASRGVLERLAANDFPTNLLPMRGNHEAMLMAFLDGPESGPFWLHNGGLETLWSYGIDASATRQSVADLQQTTRDRIPPVQMAFLRSCALSFSAGDYFFCHAGVRPGTALNHQVEHDLLWIREPFLSHTGPFGAVVVHGHTPVVEPDVRPNRINIDTGAYVTSKLTCLVLEGASKRFLST